MALTDTWSGRRPPLHWWWWRSWPLTRLSLKPPLWGGGELSHYLWGVWGSPLTLRSGGRVSPTQALGCDPGGREVLEHFLITWREGVSSLRLPFAGMGGLGPQLCYGFGWDRGSWGFLSKPNGVSGFLASPEWDIWAHTKPRDTWWFCFLSPKIPSQPVFSPPFRIASCLFHI